MKSNLKKYIKQKYLFNKARSECLPIYKSIQGGNVDNFLMPFWDKYNKQLERIFLPIPPFGFLSNPIIKSTMFVAENDVWLHNEWHFIQKIFGPKFAKKISSEDAVGKPKKVRDYTNSSANTIHHLYSFAVYRGQSGKNISDFTNVVEWGGGYGNMAKLYKRINPSGTYTIIDTPLFSTIQWLYLSSIMPEKVHILKTKKDKIISGKINILPLKFLVDTPVRSDLFISTWGLSESSKFAQDYVVKNDWFGATSFLIGFQDSTNDLKHASRLGNIAQKHGATLVDIDFIPNNHYAIK